MKPKTVAVTFKFERGPVWIASIGPSGPDSWVRALRFDRKSFKSSKTENLVDIYPGVPPLTPDITFPKFVSRFIIEAQKFATELAACGKEIICPTNYVEEYWTVSHIQNMANALKRPRKKGPTTHLKFHLKNCWKSHGLEDMTSEEIATHIRLFFGRQMTPAAVWDMTNNLGLVTKRKSGPRERDFRT